jgi:hypothetical protein
MKQNAKGAAMVRTFGVLVAAAIGGLAVCQAAGTATALTGPGQIRITANENLFTRVDTGRPGATPGDMEITRYKLYNKRIRSRPIGHAQLVCTLTGQNFRQCNGTYILPAGKITVSGAIVFRGLYDLAVTGGTARYNNVRGTLTVTRTGRNKDLLVFRLVVV